MAEKEKLFKDLEDANLPQADRDFEVAVLGHDFAGIEASLLAGADPNRVFTSQWRGSDGYRAHWTMAQSFDNMRPSPDGTPWSKGHAHAAAMKALVEAGADFSLPPLMERDGPWRLFDRPSRSSFADLGSRLWESSTLPIDSCLWFAKGRGDMSRVFGAPGSDSCSAIQSRTIRRAPAEEVFGPMWDVAIQPLMGPGGQSVLLEKCLGSGILEWSQWLIAKGATISPGSAALRMLASQTMFYANPARSGHCPWSARGEELVCAKARMEREALECASLAVELGESIDGDGGADQSPLICLLAQQEKKDIATSLLLAQKFVDLGAKPISGHKDIPFLSFALADPKHASEQLAFALSLGVNPHDRPQRAALTLLKRASSDKDKPVAKAIAKLRQLGADLAQASDHNPEGSLVAMAARSGLWESLKALASAGCDMSWKSEASGETAAALAARWSVEFGRSGGSEPTFRWLAAQGAPMDEPGLHGLTALHVASKALDFKLCKALLEAGADPNRAVADAEARTPAHLACSRFEKKKEAAQLKTLEALALHGADFSKLDAKGRSSMEIASKKAFLSVVMAVANNSQGSSLSGETGVRAAKLLGERGDGFLAVVEQSELQALSPEPASPPRKARRSL